MRSSGTCLVALSSLVFAGATLAANPADSPSRDVDSCTMDGDEDLCPLPSVVTCRMDLSTNLYNTCMLRPIYTVSHTPANHQALLRLNMRHYNTASVMVVYRGSDGWTTNIGDSQTNNGWGGDGATNSMDAELQVLGSHVDMFLNDYALTNASITHGVVLPDQYTVLRFDIKDAEVKVHRAVVGPMAPTDLELASLRFQLVWEGRGEGMLRLVGHDAEAGAVNDRVWWVAFNRVIANTSRTGKGALRAVITLSNSPAQSNLEMEAVDASMER